MAKGKTYFICCDKADLPEDVKNAWYLGKKERFIIRMSSRIYHEMLKIKDDKQLDQRSYRWATRRVDDILNDREQVWMNVGTLHAIVKCGTVM
jgi:hypothetical protein